MNSIQGVAPAKLNLFLHITSRRTDGYHNLQTIFQFIDYCDVLEFTYRSDGQLSCESTAQDLPPEQDLVLRAARLLQQHSDTSKGADIQVEKKIPMGAGLGGGSSDAATTLLALNKLWQLQLSPTQLAKLGMRLGADVPVFVHGHAAWAEGVGESLTPVNLKEPWYLVVNPNCQISTKEIFLAQDLTRDTFPITIREFVAGRSQNVCEPVVRRLYPPVGQVLDWLSQYSEEARLTGTGACIFAAFETQSAAKTVWEQLPNQWQGIVAQGKNVSPALKEFTNR